MRGRASPAPVALRPAHLAMRAEVDWKMNIRKNLRLIIALSTLLMLSCSQSTEAAAEKYLLAGGTALTALTAGIGTYTWFKPATDAPLFGFAGTIGTGFILAGGWQTLKTARNLNAPMLNRTIIAIMGISTFVIGTVLIFHVAATASYQRWARHQRKLSQKAGPEE